MHWQVCPFGTILLVGVFHHTCKQLAIMAFFWCIDRALHLVLVGVFHQMCKQLVSRALFSVH